MDDELMQRILEQLTQSFNSEKAKGVNTRIQFDMEEGDSYYLEIKNQQLTAGKGKIINPRVTIRAKSADLAAIFNGRLNANAAFFQGRIAVTGDIRQAMQISKYFK